MNLMTTTDKHDVMLLCLAETALVTVANRSKPKSRRYNKLLAAIDQIRNADATYGGTLTEDDFAEASNVFEQVEGYLSKIKLEEK